MLELYNQHVTANHLDIGVGTGYFLDKCRFPSTTPRLALLDLNPNCLEMAAKRVARYSPEVYRGNVLDPIEIDPPKFDSIGILNVLHCLPGAIETKGIVFDHLKALLNPGGVVFGSTLLYGGIRRSLLATLVFNRVNRAGAMTNKEDDLEGLERSLEQRFAETSVSVIGCEALFRAR
jgi:2-polyprenyl-3-methyl-5-hydroxy-6-metoxy-1,4-benzoquinol methylase